MDYAIDRAHFRRRINRNNIVIIVIILNEMNVPMRKVPILQFFHNSRF